MNRYTAAHNENSMFAGDDDLFTLLDVDGRESLGHKITMAWRSLTIDMTYEHFAGIVMAMAEEPNAIAARLTTQHVTVAISETSAPVTCDLDVRFLTYYSLDYMDLGYDKLARALAPLLVAAYGGHYLRADNSDVLYHNPGMSHETYRQAAVAQLANVPDAVLSYRHDDYLPRRAAVVKQVSTGREWPWQPWYRIMRLHDRFYVTDASSRVLDGPFTSADAAEPRLAFYCGV